MAVASRKIRGLRDIRTNIDRSDQFVEPYKGYLRLGSLEMERARKMVERDSLLERLRVIEERCRQIDAEKDLLLGVVLRSAENKGYTKKTVALLVDVEKKDYEGKTPDKYDQTLLLGKKANAETGGSAAREDASQKTAASVFLAANKSPRLGTEKTVTSGFRIRY